MGSRRGRAEIGRIGAAFGTARKSSVAFLGVVSRTDGDPRLAWAASRCCPSRLKLNRGLTNCFRVSTVPVTHHRRIIPCAIVRLDGSLHARPAAQSRSARNRPLPAGPSGLVAVAETIVEGGRPGVGRRRRSERGAADLPTISAACGGAGALAGRGLPRSRPARRRPPHDAHA